MEYQCRFSSLSDCCPNQELHFGKYPSYSIKNVSFGLSFCINIIEMLLFCKEPCINSWDCSVSRNCHFISMTLITVADYIESSSSFSFRENSQYPESIRMTLRSLSIPFFCAVAQNSINYLWNPSEIDYKLIPRLPNGSTASRVARETSCVALDSDKNFVGFNPHQLKPTDNLNKYYRKDILLISWSYN